MVSRKKRVISSLLLVLAFVIMPLDLTIPAYADAVPAAFKDVDITKHYATMEVGSVLTLNVPNVANKINWETSNKKIVAITPSTPTIQNKYDKSCKLTAKKVGTVIITAKITYDWWYTCTVNVVDNNTNISSSNQEMTLNKSNATMETGSILKLKVTGAPGKIKWYSSNKKIAKVASNGKVTAKKKGKVTISATCGSKKVTCEIDVVKSTEKDFVGLEPVVSTETPSPTATPVPTAIPTATPEPTATPVPTATPTPTPTAVPTPVPIADSYDNIQKAISYMEDYYDYDYYSYDEEQYNNTGTWENFGFISQYYINRQTIAFTIIPDDLVGANEMLTLTINVNDLSDVKIESFYSNSSKTVTFLGEGKINPKSFTFDTDPDVSYIVLRNVDYSTAEKLTNNLLRLLLLYTDAVFLREMGLSFQDIGFEKLVID